MPSIEFRVDKWKMHRFYAKNPFIAKYLPPTKLFTEQTLTSFLKQYKSVYVKATRVHTGRGIVKAWESGGRYRYVKIKGLANGASSTRELYQKVNKSLPMRPIIIQKAINLASINGRSFDIRVMMMRDAERRWQYGGIVAKVAGSGSIINNVQRGGGYVMPVETALRKSLSCGKERAENIKNELIQLSRRIIQYSEKYPFFSYQSGIDLAVDKNGKIWIIEVNLYDPSHGLFRQLKDQTYFRRIRRLYWAFRKNNKRLI